MAKGRKKGTLFGKPRGKVVKHPGALTAQANRAGKSISGLCASKRAKHGTLAKRCSLAKAFKTMRGEKRSKARKGKSR